MIHEMRKSISKHNYEFAPEISKKLIIRFGSLLIPSFINIPKANHNQRFGNFVRSDNLLMGFNSEKIDMFT